MKNTKTLENQIIFKQEKVSKIRGMVLFLWEKHFGKVWPNFKLILCI